MNNLMSGDNSGAEPQEHDPRCRMACTDDECTFRDGHYCTCDDLAADDAAREAEALLDWREAADAFAAGAWVASGRLVPFYDYELDPALSEGDET